MIELLGKSKTELTEFCVGLGEPPYRGAQLYHALYVERIFDIASMTTLPAALRERLVNEASVTLPVVRQRYVSQDGSVRYLFALPGSTGAVKDGWDDILLSQLDNRHRPCNLVELMPRLQEHLSGPAV